MLSTVPMLATGETGTMLDYLSFMGPNGSSDTMILVNKKMIIHPRSTWHEVVPLMQSRECGEGGDVLC